MHTYIDTDGGGEECLTNNDILTWKYDCPWSTPYLTLFQPLRYDNSSSSWWSAGENNKASSDITRSNHYTYTCTQYITITYTYLSYLRRYILCWYTFSHYPPLSLIFFFYFLIKTQNELVNRKWHVSLMTTADVFRTNFIPRLIYQRITIRYGKKNRKKMFHFSSRVYSTNL